MTADLVFEEPPSSQNGPASRGRLAAMLAPLRDRPGEWARLPGDWHQTKTTVIKRGNAYGIEPGEFEATARKAEAPGRWIIYVRYVGQVQA